MFLDYFFADLVRDSGFLKLTEAYGLLQSLELVGMFLKNKDTFNECNLQSSSLLSENI